MTTVPRELVVVPFRAHQYLWGLIDPWNQTSTSLNMLFTDNLTEILHALSAQLSPLCGFLDIHAVVWASLFYVNVHE